MIYLKIYLGCSEIITAHFTKNLEIKEVHKAFSKPREKARPPKPNPENFC